MNHQGDSAIPFASSGEASTRSPSVLACREVMLAAMSVRLDGLLARLDEALNELADKADSQALFRLHVQALHILRRRREAVASGFLAALAESWAALQKQPLPRSIADAPSDTGVTPAGRREEELVLGNLISKAESRYREVLAVLRARLAAELGRDRLADGADPLGPPAICAAFRSALAALDGLDLSVKLMAYKLFDKQVLDALEEIYARCLAHLDPGDGLPSAGPPAKRIVPRRQAPSPVSIAAVGAGGSPVFERLCRLLQHRQQPRALTPPGAVLVQTQELISALLRLQERAAAGGAGADRGPLRVQLHEELRLRDDPAAARALIQTDESTLELVLLLFERILADQALPDAVREQIARLQIPIAKVALLDKGFFERADHPARRLLDHLARSARGWIDDGGRAPDGVHGRIRQAVEQVLADHGRDPAVFARLDADLGRKLAHEEEQARASEVWLCRELEERERRANVRALVHSLIEQRMGAYEELPDVVTALVYEGWEQVMVAAYLVGGETGERWRGALATLDRLLWSVQPKLTDEDRRELLRGIPELLSTLRKSLAEVSYDQRRLAASFRELQALHLAVLRRTEGPASVDVAAVGAGLAVPASAACQRTAERPPAAGLKIGTWVEMPGGEGPVRVKLAWHGAQSGIHLFVDRRGEKALELGRSDLEALCARELVVVLGDDATPLVERAIANLVQALEGA